jgi:thiol-disulfide isomerase/thioredoxin
VVDFFGETASSARMKFSTSSIVAVLAAGFTVQAVAAEGWVNDWAKAKATAAESKRDLLVDFTGSDWCGWCIKLKEEVFSKPEFEAVNKDFVLVELDFPRDKSKLSEETQKQNAALQKEFAVRGFPTIMLCDASGRPYARTGYQAGGPGPYLEQLAKLRKVRDERDAAFAEAEKATGAEKAKLLAKGLGVIDEDCLHPFYDGTLAEIAKLDPEDTTGIVKREKQRGDFQALETALGGTKDLDARITLIDKFIAEQKPEGEIKQRVLFTKSGAYYSAEKKAEAAKYLDEIIAIDANSELGKRAVEVKQRFFTDAAATKDAAAPKEAGK